MGSGAVPRRNSRGVDLVFGDIAMPMTRDATGAAIASDAWGLMKELRLSPTDAMVVWDDDRMLVLIFECRKKPPLIKWKGRRVEYSIGGGMPQAQQYGATP